MEAGERSLRPSPEFISFVSVALLAFTVRALLIPPSYAIPGVDELGYVADGLLMLEGVTPGYKFAPAALTTWASFLYGFVTWLLQSLDFMLSRSTEPVLVRPLLALDATLFRLYADMSGIRLALQIVSASVSMLGVGAAWMLGRRQAGWPGGLLAGGLMALVPMMVTQAVASRPYAGAWSLAVMAVSASILLSGRPRWIVTGLCLGLSISSRIEMLLIVPAVMWGFLATENDDRRIEAILATTGVTTATFLVSAPWYITHLIGNIRKIVTVKLLSVNEWNAYTPAEGFRINGLEPALVLLTLGLFLRIRRDRWLALTALLVVAMGVMNALRPTSSGLRHQGDLLVYLVVFSAFALAGVQRLMTAGKRERIISGGLVILILTVPAYQTAQTIRLTRNSWVKSAPVEWIEEHVRESTPLFFNGGIIAAPTKVPLPTAESADRIWRELADPNAWRQSFERRLVETGLRIDAVPRALSMEHMYQRLGGERRYFILGGAPESDRPRYDLRLGPGGEIDGREMQEFLLEYERTGGVFLYYGQPIGQLGRPAKSWIAPDRSGVFVYRREVIRGPSLDECGMRVAQACSR